MSEIKDNFPDMEAVRMEKKDASKKLTPENSVNSLLKKCRLQWEIWTLKNKQTNHKINKQTSLPVSIWVNSFIWLRKLILFIDSTSFRWHFFPNMCLQPGLRYQSDNDDCCSH